MNAATLSRLYGREPVSAYVDERWRLLPRDTGAVAYHRVGRTAITVGAPLGPREDSLAATLAFREHCRSKGWRPVLFQTAAPVEGLKSHLVAKEAFLDVSSFSLSGSSMANARHSVSRARRDGVQVSWRRWSECDAKTRAEMALISRSWSGKRPELTFTYGRLSDIPESAWVGLATAPGGRIEALSTWRPLPAGPGLVLDLIRRRKDATPGVVELLVVEAVEFGRSEGLAWLSLGSVCQSEDLPRWLRIALASAEACGGTGLTSFKQKFRPRWEDRYLAVPAGATGLAGVMGLAIAHLRGTPPVRLEPVATRRRPSPGLRWAATAGVTGVMCAFAVGAAAHDAGWQAIGPIQFSAARAGQDRALPALSTPAPSAELHLIPASLPSMLPVVVEEAPGPFSVETASAALGSPAVATAGLAPAAGSSTATGPCPGRPITGAHPATGGMTPKPMPGKPKNAPVVSTPPSQCGVAQGPPQPAPTMAPAAATGKHTPPSPPAKGPTMKSSPQPKTGVTSAPAPASTPKP